MPQAVRNLRLVRPAAPGARLVTESYESARTRWCTFADRHLRAHLYHRDRWLKVLARAYGFRLMVAELRWRTELLAACVMARTKLPAPRALIALPFSDDCAPLAVDDDSSAMLLAALADSRPAPLLEIRGVGAAPPWRNADVFQHWELNLLRPAARIFAGLADNFARNMRRARRANVAIDRGNSRAHLARFLALHSESRHRQGVPCQPKRFFEAILDVFGDDASIWCARGSERDLAAVFVLRDGGRIYYKWSARDPGDTLGAGHLAAWSIIEEFAGRAAIFDLGRADSRNDGLNRFKHEMGATASPLPYSYLPRAPLHVSSEIPTGLSAIAAGLWRRLPVPLCRSIENAIYPYLA